MDKLAGKVALVTGAGRGIGPSIARRLAEDGATIIVGYGNSRAGADAVVQELSSNGARAFAVQADLAHRKDILRMFEQIDRETDKLDIIINCAGYGGGLTPLLDEVDVSLVETTLGVNLLAPFYVAAEGAKRMPSGGRIVNFSSSVAHFIFPGSSVYAGAKAAIETSTKVWAKELGGKGITVNCVIPGAVSPGMMDGSPEHREFFENASPFGRVGRADEIASLVAFLCSPEASWVSGACILANGAANA
jgi:3-oxoacyl-[acyl-carrier protein] reductase